MPQSLALVGAAILLCGCMAAPPDEEDWREASLAALEDAVSLVRTAELTLRQAEDGRTVGHLAVVVLTQTEQRLGATTSSLSERPLPIEHAGEAERVLGTLQRALGELRAARVLVAAGGTNHLGPAIEQLEEQGELLERLETRVAGQR